MPWKTRVVAAETRIEIVNTHHDIVASTPYTPHTSIAAISLSNHIIDVMNSAARVRRGDANGNAGWDSDCVDKVQAIGNVLTQMKKHWLVFRGRPWARPLARILFPIDRTPLTEAVRELLNSKDGACENLFTLSHRPEHPLRLFIATTGDDTPLLHMPLLLYPENRILKLTRRRDAACDALNDLDEKDYHGDKVNLRIYANAAKRKSEAERCLDMAQQEADRHIAVRDAGWDVVVRTLNAFCGWQNPRDFPTTVQAMRAGIGDIEAYGREWGASLLDGQQQDAQELGGAVQGVLSALECFDAPVDRNRPLIEAAVRAVSQVNEIDRTTSVDERFAEAGEQTAIPLERQRTHRRSRTRNRPSAQLGLFDKPLASP
jgi:hypothetical protein